MTSCASKIRVLSIDPASRGFGFAVLEGVDRLIDWGVVHARTNKNRTCLKRIKQLVDRYRPQAVVIEDVERGSRRGPRVRRLLRCVRRLAEKKRIRVKAISKGEVRKLLPEADLVNKQRVAEMIARRFPELGPYLPKPRRPWQSEAEMMAVFDAVGFALAR